MAFAVSKQGCSAILAAGFAVAGAVIEPAAASVIVGSPSLPLLGVPFVSPTGVGCFPKAMVCVTPGTLTLTSTVSSIFILVPAVQEIVATADFDAALTTLGGTPIGPFGLTGTVEEVVLGRASNAQTGTWPTELTSLDLTGQVLGGTLTATLAPTPSVGTTSIDRLEHGFLISSSFDIFLDLSLPPLSTSVGPIHVEAVPESSTWALMLVGFAGLGFAAYRRAAVSTV